MSLDELGLKYGTDKASNGHDYLKVYETYFAPLQDEDISFLELGWWDGASMRMWRDYFPNARIVGLDIELKEAVPGVDFTLASQDDKEVAGMLADAYGGFDVIVDDASHLSPLTIASFEAYWHHLNAGGLYIVEDLQVSYHRDWLGNPDANRPGPQGQTSMQFLRALADDVHFGHASAGPVWSEYNIDHLAFYPGLCIVRKGVS